MILDKEFESMLNKQYTNEIASAMLYRNIAGYYEDKYFPGFAKYFLERAEEEMEHAQNFYDYIALRDGKPQVLGISEESIKFTPTNDLTMGFVASLKHEQLVSSYINLLMDKAKELKDYASEKFLYDFCDEQVHEEAEFLDLVHEVELIKNDPGDIIKMSKRLGGECLAKISVD